jgi:hypothetical protein
MPGILLWAPRPAAFCAASCAVPHHSDRYFLLI